MISINTGRSLARALHDRDMNQTQLAELMNTTPTMVSRWTKNNGSRTGTINRICAALDMRPSEFIALGEEG